MATNDNRAMVEAAVEELFTNGLGQKAYRLALISENDRDLGGWGKSVIRDKLNDLIALAVAAERTRVGDDLQILVDNFRKPAPGMDKWKALNLVEEYIDKLRGATDED